MQSENFYPAVTDGVKWNKVLGKSLTSFSLFFWVYGVFKVVSVNSVHWGITPLKNVGYLGWELVFEESSILHVWLNPNPPWL